jgi:hypothetical protein
LDRKRVVLTRTRNGYALRSFDFTQSIFEVFEGKGARTRAVRECSEKGYDLMNNPQSIPDDPSLQEREVKA